MTGKPGKKMRILAVEDEQELRILYEDYFSSQGYEVELASDGLEGAIKAENSLFDLILIDMRMPRMDGYNLVRRIRGYDKKTPIIVITAYGYVYQVVQMMRLGINGYVTKPIDFDELTRKIEEIIEVEEALEKEKN